MVIYQTKPTYHECYQVTAENLQELATWCNGHVLFKTLPVSERQVELNKESKHLRAEIGDWIVKESVFHFRAYSPDGFDRKYIQVGN